MSSLQEITLAMWKSMEIQCESKHPGAPGVPVVGAPGAPPGVTPGPPPPGPARKPRFTFRELEVN